MSPRTEDQLRQNREARTTQIISAALDVFSEKGYFAANVADVAAKADVSQGTIYHYFDTKEELFMAVFEQWETQAMAEGLHGAAESTDTATDRLALLAGRIGDYMARSAAFFPANLEFWSHIPRNGEIRAHFRRIFAELRGTVASIVQDGIDQGEFKPIDPEQTASLLMAVFDGLLLQYLADPATPDWAQMTDTLTRLVLKGLLVDSVDTPDSPTET